jgi:hypothetical protein
MHRDTVARSWGPLSCHSSANITSCFSMIIHGPILKGSVHNSWKLIMSQFFHGLHTHPLSMFVMLHQYSQSCEIYRLGCNEFNWLNSVKSLKFLHVAFIFLFSVHDQLQIIESAIKDYQNALDSSITLNELQDKVQPLQPKKGLWCWWYPKQKMIKHTDHKFQLTILKLFNIILSSGIFPNIWNQGLITPMHKQISPQ